MISPASRSSALRKIVEREAIGDAEAGGRAKHLGAGERLAFQAAGELLDVDAEATQRLGHVAHNARPLATEDVEGDEPLWAFRPRPTRRARR